MIKPILYIDVDGVLFGYYGEPVTLQLRPGVSSFLLWASQRFECFWLTCWPKDALLELWRQTYQFGGAPFPTYVAWHDKSRQLSVSDRKTAAIRWDAEWFWLEDGPVGVERMDLRHNNAMDRWIEVRYEGADELVRIRKVLEEKLAALAARTHEGSVQS